MPKLNKHYFIFMQTIGKKGEELASKFLVKLGYRIVERNYRYKKSEIDIICTGEELLIFVEVKTRSSRDFGEPESFVSKNQQSAIIRASEEYVLQTQWEGDIRFDIIAIIQSAKEQEIMHFKDAFY